MSFLCRVSFRFRRDRGFSFQFLWYNCTTFFKSFPGGVGEWWIQIYKSDQVFWPYDIGATKAQHTSLQLFRSPEEKNTVKSTRPYNFAIFIRICDAQIMNRSTPSQCETRLDCELLCKRMAMPEQVASRQILCLKIHNFYICHSDHRHQYWNDVVNVSLAWAMSNFFKMPNILQIFPQIMTFNFLLPVLQNKLNRCQPRPLPSSALVSKHHHYLFISLDIHR